MSDAQEAALRAGGSLDEASRGWETAARRHHKATNAPGSFEDCTSDWCAEAKAGIAALRGPQATEPTGSASSIDLREGET